MVPSVCRKTHESFFSRSHLKKGSLWEKIYWKKSHKTFGKFGGLRATILRTPQNFPVPTTLMSRDWPKICLQEGPKEAKFHFHHSKQRKQLFLQKNMMGKCQILKSLGALPYPPTPMPLKLFITNRPREITKICLLISIAYNEFCKEMDHKKELSFIEFCKH